MIMMEKKEWKNMLKRTTKKIRNFYGRSIGMKFPKDVEFYVVIFLFLVVIFISVFGNSAKVSPYQINSSLLAYPYEAFATNDDNDDKRKKEGMKGMSELNSSPIYDPISKLEGNSSCVGNSPYSNSLGGLCISNEAKMAMETRGGNAKENQLL
jgi:hypothetical protein